MQAVPNTEFDYQAFMTKYDDGIVHKFDKATTIYTQGDPTKSLFYIIKGAVKVIVNSEHGKIAVIAMLDAGDFFGEGCLDGNLLELSTIVTAEKSEIIKFKLEVISRALKEDHDFSQTFMKFLLSRNAKLRTDLVAHLFNSSEKRLARILLTLANTGLATASEFIDVPVNQDTLAMMVGTTRPRINRFMNKFREFGYIDYSAGHIKVRSSLMNVILDDSVESLKHRPPAEYLKRLQVK
jgi:CRP/FNR family cyclic AMP-dependent transcriptional regulator